MTSSRTSLASGHWFKGSWSKYLFSSFLVLIVRECRESAGVVPSGRFWIANVLVVDCAYACEKENQEETPRCETSYLEKPEAGQEDGSKEAFEEGIPEEEVGQKARFEESGENESSRQKEIQSEDGTRPRERGSGEKSGLGSRSIRTRGRSIAVSRAIGRFAGSIGRRRRRFRKCG